jgi:hypothetical protein
MTTERKGEITIAIVGIIALVVYCIYLFDEDRRAAEKMCGYMAMLGQVSVAEKCIDDELRLTKELHEKFGE